MVNWTRVMAAEIEGIDNIFMRWNLQDLVICWIWIVRNREE